MLLRGRSLKLRVPCFHKIDPIRKAPLKDVTSDI